MSQKIRNFKIGLDTKEISNLINELKSYKNTLWKKTYEYCRLMAEDGVNYAIKELIIYQEVELLEAMHTELLQIGNGECVYAVVCDDERGCFIEFGTGWVGKDNPYPYTVPQGNYGEYTGYVTGHQIVKNAMKGITGWWYKGADGDWHFTEGQKYEPFMYQTAQHLLDIAVTKAKQVFQRY